MRQPHKRIGWPTIIGLGLVVGAFTVLSLFVTATGTARFAVAMGYDARIGYVVGAAFELAKEVLPVVWLALLAQRAFAIAGVLGLAWLCLVAFSCLANTRDGRDRHLIDRAHRHLEDGGAGQYQGRAGQHRTATCRLEPPGTAAAGQDRT